MQVLSYGPGAVMPLAHKYAIDRVRDAVQLCTAAHMAKFGPGRYQARQDAAAPTDLAETLWPAVQQVLFQWGLPNGRDAVDGAMRQDAISLPSESFIDLAWKTVERPRSPNNMLSLLPSESFGSWANDAVRVRISETTGAVQVWSGGRDLQPLGLNVEAFDLPIVALISEAPAGYYAVERAGVAGVNLRAELDRWAPLAHDEEHNRLSITGNPVMGVQGLANLVNANRHDPGYALSTITGAQLYAEMSRAVSLPAINNRQAVDCSRGYLVMSPEVAKLARDSVFTTGDAKSVMERFRLSYPEVEIREAHECNDFLSGYTVMFALPRDSQPGAVSLLRLPAFQVPIVQTPMMSVVHHISATAGVFTPAPQATAFIQLSRS